MSSMHEPRDFARRAEESPQLPAGDGEKVSGYGVMGLTFASGHVLGLRRWTASSVGDGFTSVWHRDPDGRWTFYETSPCEVACHRYFGADVDRVSTGPIELEWEGGRRLRVRAEADGGIDWAIEIGATATTRLLSRVGPALPTSAWRSPIVLSAMGRVAGTALGVGTVKLTGLTSNGQHFDANPLRVWYVTASRAVVAGEDLGQIGPLDEQAHMADFYFPQRGIFAVGRVFVAPAVTADGSRDSFPAATTVP
jgi:hypothetical protein